MVQSQEWRVADRLLDRYNLGAAALVWKPAGFACAQPVNLRLVAGVRFELTTFGL